MSGESSKLSKDELREDEFVDWIMHAVEYVKARSQLFVGGLIGLVLVIFAVDYFIDSQDRARTRAAGVLGEAMLAEEAGQTDEAMRLLSQEVLARYDGTLAAGQAALMLGNRHYARGEYAEARRMYQLYLDDYAQAEPLVYAASSGLAACLEAEGRVAEAASAYRGYAANHPGTVQAAMALWEAARCYRHLDDAAAQREVLQQITQGFADLPLASRARSELALLDSPNPSS